MSLRVIVVDDENDRAHSVKDALEANGFIVDGVFGTSAGLHAKVAELAADVIIVDIDSPPGDRRSHRPVPRHADGTGQGQKHPGRTQDHRDR